MFVHRYPALIPDSQPESAVRISSPMWRKLLTCPLLPPGSAVLVVGERPLDAIDLLVDLAYDVTGVCSDPEVVIAGRLICPKADFHLWRADTQPLPTSRRFDFVLATDPAFHAANLYSLSTRLWTAQLLAAVKPEARLVFLTQPSQRFRHRADCWRRHLSCFAGSTSSELLEDGWRRWVALPWTGVWNCLPPVLAVTWQAPSDELPPEIWQQSARQASLTGTRICCVAARSTPDVARRAG